MHNKGLSFPEVLTLIVIAIIGVASGCFIVRKHHGPVTAAEVQQVESQKQAAPPVAPAPPVTNEWLISDDKTPASNIHMWVITNPKTSQKWLITNWNGVISVTPGVIPDPVEPPKAPVIEAVEPSKAKQ
jgi:hypothetical protein